MVYHFRHVRIGPNTRHPKLWMLVAGVLLLSGMLALMTGKAFAFNGFVEWDGWHQVLQSEAPAAPAPVPTVDPPGVADYTVTTPPPSGCTDLCIPGEQTTRFMFVRQSNEAIDYLDETLNSSTGWGPLNVVPGNGLALGSPSAIQYGNKLYLFVHGTNNGLYMTTWSGTWLGRWVRVTTTSGSAVSLASNPDAIVYNNKLYVFTRQSDSTITFYTTTDGAHWTPNVVPGGGLTSSSPTAAINGSTNVLYLFVQGTNNIVCVQTLNGTTWAAAGWQTAMVGPDTIPTSTGLGASFGTDANADNVVDLFVRQTDGSVQWYIMTTGDGRNWSSQGEVPTNGRIFGAPFAISPDAPSLFVEGTDGNVWENDQIIVQG